MRFVSLSLFCLMVFISGCESCKRSSDSVSTSDQTSESERILPESVPSDDHVDDDMPIGEISGNEVEHFKAFQLLLSTDAKKARVELRKVAKLRFGDHKLRSEWVDLFFRLSRRKKGNILELKRLNELQLTMLTDIDVKKHAKEIESHQKALTQFNEIVKMLESQGTVLETYETDFVLNFNPDK